jgi:ribosomal protein L5
MTKSFSSNLRYKENIKYISSFDSLTKFHFKSIYLKPNIIKVVLTLNFKIISFKEKNIIPFILALELLTSQKMAITTTKKPIVSLKVRKGAFVGCKLTLQNMSFYHFLDYLNLSLLRSKTFQVLNINKIKKSDTNSYLMQLQDLFNFFQLELNLNYNLLLLYMVWVFNTQSYEKKTFLFSSVKIPIYLNNL